MLQTVGRWKRLIRIELVSNGRTVSSFKIENRNKRSVISILSIIFTDGVKKENI